MITLGLAYLLIASYFILERILRKGEAALNLQPQASDAGSSRLLWGSSMVGLLGLFLAPFLNAYGIAKVQSTAIAWGGIGLMLLGLSLRYWAAQEMGAYYTRTLQVLPEHAVIETGPYRIIRHPGYLGTSLLSWGAGLALQNGLVLGVVIVTDAIAKYYRIQAEEKMLTESLGVQYQTYAATTWRFIPFVY
jgi:protein-S-isoprenylcysteine O-methyltransferase Ste14